MLSCRMNSSSLTDDSDVPPLEDMSDLLLQAKQLQQIKERKESGGTSRSPGSGMVTASPDPGLHQGSCAVAIEDSRKDTQVQDDGKNVSTAAKPVAKSSNSFGGMRKGFLFGPPTKSSKPRTEKQNDGRNRSQKNEDRLPTHGSTSDSIPLIKPQGDGAQNGAQRIPEVQEALKASAPFLQNKDWISEDLLTKIEKNPRLARQMADPRFSQAMAMFQTNPQGAMQHFQNSPDIQLFFKEFCEILGDHFSKLGASSDPSSTSSGQHTTPVSPAQSIRIHDRSSADMKVASSTDPKQATAADEARMREIMSDPEVVNAFGDPRTRILFEALRASPDKAQEMMQTADAEFRRHIKTLLDKGLLGFAR